MSVESRKRARRRAPSVLDMVTPQCLLGAIFLAASLFFLCIAFMEQGDTDGAQISVGKIALKMPAAKKKFLRAPSAQRDADVPLRPFTSDEVLSYLSDFLRQLHARLAGHKEGTTFHEVWAIYHNLTVHTLYEYDQELLSRMPPRRDDDSIFLSLASYRDENCPNTIFQAYRKAKNPERLFVGLVQQNCVANCLSGVLEGGVKETVEPDVDCHRVFCESDEGRPYCEAGNVRALHIDESESLGPYAARYFASKLWSGESWFLQIDAHMTFAQDWDSQSAEMLQKAPSHKPVLSHYPPEEGTDFEKVKNRPAPRLCGPVFADSPIEQQIVRLEGSWNYDKVWQETPRFAPFVAAGYFVAHSDFLREVPFDPFLPWIFMGEEILMSSRLWTAGYDIFSPTHSVVGHIYFRRHKPKFWESVNRLFWPGIFNPLQELILGRVKYLLKYPEAARDMIMPKSLLTAVEKYGMGKERRIEDYLEMVGLDPLEKRVFDTAWCETGQPPPWAKASYSHLYPHKAPRSKPDEQYI